MRPTKSEEVLAWVCGAPLIVWLGLLIAPVIEAGRDGFLEKLMAAVSDTLGYEAVFLYLYT